MIIIRVSGYFPGKIHFRSWWLCAINRKLLMLTFRLKHSEVTSSKFQLFRARVEFGGRSGIWKLLEKIPENGALCNVHVWTPEGVTPAPSIYHSCTRRVVRAASSPETAFLSRFSIRIPKMTKLENVKPPRHSSCFAECLNHVLRCLVLGIYQDRVHFQACFSPDYAFATWIPVIGISEFRIANMLKKLNQLSRLTFGSLTFSAFIEGVAVKHYHVLRLSYLQISKYSWLNGTHKSNHEPSIVFY